MLDLTYFENSTYNKKTELDFESVLVFALHRSYYELRIKELVELFISEIPYLLR